MEKKSVPPVVAGIVIALLVVIIGWFFYREAGNVGSLPPGAVGNPGPFSPGGAAVKGGNKAGIQPPSRGPGGNPGQPH